jgi:hypothetical protein
MKIKCLPELYFPKQTNLLAKLYQKIGGHAGPHSMMMQKYLWDYRSRKSAGEGLENRADEILLAVWEVLREHRGNSY